MTIYLYVKQHRVTGLKYFGKTTHQDPYKYIGSGLYWSAHLIKHGNDVETLCVWPFENAQECSQFAIEFSRANNITESVEWANLKDENGQDGGFHGYRWYSNGKQDQLCLKSPGEGWSLGRKNQSSITKGHRWYNNGTINVSSPSKPSGDKWTEGMLPKSLPSIKNGTHNFLQPRHQQMLREINANLLASGQHSTQRRWHCEKCNKSGSGLSNFSRWHGKNCRS